MVSIFVVLLLVYGVQGISYAQDEPDDTIVEFKDINLAKAVRRQLGLPTGDGVDLLNIPKVELEKLTTLSARDRGISNLTGLEHATQLKYLDLAGNNIINITPLAQLIQLTELNLRGYNGNNNVRDLTPLAQLTQLTTLDFGYNNVRDLTPLAQLTQLTELDFFLNDIIDITPLAKLTQLRTLDLSENKINDVTPLAQLTQLTTLDLSGNKINDVTPLAQLTQLTELNLEDNNIIDITPLAQLTLLNDLDLSSNFISDVTPLAQLIRLENLDLFRMESLKDITPLAQLPGTLIKYSYNVIYSNKIRLLAVSTLQPLTSTTLDGSSVTLTLLPGGAAYDTSINNIINALTVTGLVGVTVSDVVRVSDKELKVTLGFTGSLEKRTTLTISLGPEAVTGYEGRVLTGGIYVYPETLPVYPEADHIQGPWLWMVVPTDPAGGDGISTEIDSLADASTGTITEAYIAQNGVNEADFIGQLQWLSSEIHWTEHHCQKYSITRQPNLILSFLTLGLLQDECIDPTVCWANNINNLVDALDMGTELASGERTAYALVNVITSREQKVVMSVKSGDAIKIWLNGNVVHREAAESYNCRKVYVPLACDPEICTTDPAIQESEVSEIPVTLKVGNNLLLVKVRQHGEYWDMRVGLTGDFITLIPKTETPSPPQTPTEATPATDTMLSISPSPVQSPAIGEQLTLSLNIAGGENVAGYQTTVQFDETALRYVSSANGDYLPAGAYFVPPVVEGNRVSLNAVSLAGESNGDGTLATLTFEVIAVKASALTLSDALLTNSAGTTSVPNIENAEITGPAGLKGDVNGDGTVNIADLVLVAGALGTTGQNAADVNGDGQVNIADLVLVAGALGTSATAPSLDPQLLSTLTAAEVEQWHSQAQQLNLTDTTSQRGILFLQQLLEVLNTPEKTALLANYPNPFNPETWIPYHLAKDADVTLHIYAMDGTLVRTLALGHQAAGMYQNRSRAAYWDGENEFGESVASGVYFYTLTAGDFSATRKMLIMK